VYFFASLFLVTLPVRSLLSGYKMHVGVGSVCSIQRVHCYILDRIQEMIHDEDIVKAEC